MCLPFTDRTEGIRTIIKREFTDITAALVVVSADSYVELVVHMNDRIRSSELIAQIVSTGTTLRLPERSSCHPQGGDNGQDGPEPTHAFYMFLLYCPPTSNMAAVSWPSEQYLVASIRTSNIFSFLIAAC